MNLLHVAADIATSMPPIQCSSYQVDINVLNDSLHAAFLSFSGKMVMKVVAILLSGV